MPAPTAEERSLVDSMPHILWINGPDGTVIYFNARWTEYTGVPLDESVARGTGAFVHPDDLAAILPLFTRARERGESIGSTPSPSGSSRWAGWRRRWGRCWASPP